MVEAVIDSRNPAKVRAGKAAALKRWGPTGTRVVRIGDLSPPERRLVLALIEAVKAEQRASPEAA